MQARIKRNYSQRNFRKKRTPDKFSPKQRSALMSKIKSKNTAFEKDFFRLLKQKCSRLFKTHFGSILGKPDIVFLKEKVCVFLDSDFWHGWQYPRWMHLLKNEFWRNKITSNRKRDIKITRYLRRTSWKVLRFWGHELRKDPGWVVQRINQALMS
jgi:DNA mismatch endonuclease Vsr